MRTKAISRAVRAAAHRALEHELPERVDFSRTDEALDAAAELARAPRSSWAQPADEWERLVVALAVVVVRVEGGLRATRARAVRAIRVALEDFQAARRPRGGGIGSSGEVSRAGGPPAHFSQFSGVPRVVNNKGLS